MTTQRKKLIEVSIPLEVINVASASEKSPRRGHPSTLHLWWARRPLAACRAIIFAQLVDDPSSWPDLFPTHAEQERERARLHRVIEDFVPWSATSNPRIFAAARYEIAKSIARERGDSLPPQNDDGAILAYLQQYAPPVCDPFCGSGSIPLEAQRFGLRAYGSDINPVAVLISKATCEIPTMFANCPPVNIERDENHSYTGTSGLASDIRWYSKKLMELTYSDIGQFYTKVRITSSMASNRPDLKVLVGEELTVVAWMWARTVASPNPALFGAHVPLVRTFDLCTKPSKRCWIEPVIRSTRGEYDFTVRQGEGPSLKGTINRSGGTCIFSGTPIPFKYIRAEAQAGRMCQRLMAVVVQGPSGRIYLDPTQDLEDVANAANPQHYPVAPLPNNPRDCKPLLYGMKNFSDLFTRRQLMVLSALSGNIEEIRQNVLDDATASGMSDDSTRLADGGTGAVAYADAITTYLGLCISRQVNRSSSLNFWWTGGETVQQVYARQALAMVWDFCESNPFSNSSGNFLTQVEYLANCIEHGTVSYAPAAVIQHDAAKTISLPSPALITTDPPYYDNITYSDLSDFFYVWQRMCLSDIWPALYGRVLTPKSEELIALSLRHDGKASAEQFFMKGMRKALDNAFDLSIDNYPVAIFYAFKQSESIEGGVTSRGWASFLQSLVDAGYTIEGTWPVRTENAIALKKRVNALSSSIVLVCRKRPKDAPTITSKEFIIRLRKVLPDALKDIRDGGVNPVDMSQASLGPGMGVFTTVSKILEPDDSTMPVHKAIALINQVRDEIHGAESVAFDQVTRFCIEWYEKFGMNTGRASDAIVMSQAYNIGINDLKSVGVFLTQCGDARLIDRSEMTQESAQPVDDGYPIWKCVQRLAHALNSISGGVGVAAKIYSTMSQQQCESSQLLAYRMYDICEKCNAQEALVWNNLVQEWGILETEAREFFENTPKIV